MSNSWKDFLAFSQKEQVGITVLLAILLLLIILNPLIPKMIKKDKMDMEQFREEVEAFVNEKKKRDSMEKIQVTKPAYTAKAQKDLQTFLKSPFYFDPNTVSEDSLKMTGISEYAARNIVNYRKKGGKFRGPEDLKKIYGMKSEWYENLRLYIRIKEEDLSKAEEDKTHTASEVQKDPIIIFTPEKESIYLELNAADTSDLVQCTGIGPSFAGRIVAYRKLLGGYSNKGQLLEVTGMDSARYFMFRDQVWVDPELVVKMNINSVEFKEMLRHPYFEFYLVKAIFNYRDGKKIIDSVGELRVLPEMYPELFEKISPYLEAQVKD
jgi:DNA uptake protein ComE-like DNA-binding protein